MLKFYICLFYSVILTFMGVVHILAINSLFFYTIPYLILIQKKIWYQDFEKNKTKQNTDKSWFWSSICHLILEQIFQISCLIYYAICYKNFQALSFYVPNTIICYFEGEVNIFWFMLIWWTIVNKYLCSICFSMNLRN